MVCLGLSQLTYFRERQFSSEHRAAPALPRIRSNVAVRCRTTAIVGARVSNGVLVPIEDRRALVTNERVDGVRAQYGRNVAAVTRVSNYLRRVHDRQLALLFLVIPMNNLRALARRIRATFLRLISYRNADQGVLRLYPLRVITSTLRSNNEANEVAQVITSRRSKIVNVESRRRGLLVTIR